MKRATVLMLALLLLLAAGCSAGRREVTMCAEYPWYETAQDAVDDADLVFSGTVLGWSYEDLIISEGGDPLPYTVYQVQVDTIYKGEWPEETVPIKVLGGERSGVWYVLDGTPEIAQGGQYLFAVGTYEDSYPSLINLDQAVFPLDGTAEIGVGENPVTLAGILACFES